MVSNAAAPPPRADGSITHSVVIKPHTEPTAAIADNVSAPPLTNEQDGNAPELHIDPRAFAVLQKALSDLDTLTDHEQLEHQQQWVDEATPVAVQPDAPASNPALPEASNTVSPQLVADPNGQPSGALASDPALPEASAVAQPQPVAGPNGPAAATIGQEPVLSLQEPAA
jgi:hypothetical protein